jgi:2-polyprenyl-3-methyl-5-hydroxy-6-metoxy-1,4-benzoquinol methylase
MKKLLFNKNINLTNTEKFLIERNFSRNCIELHFKAVQNTQYIPYPSLDDSDEYIFGYANKLTQIENKSVLIVGLGLGLMASYLQDKCPLVHVVEIEQELIDIISSNGYLNSNVTLFQGDIFTFNTDNKYDLIVNDIYWDVNDQFETNNQYLINKFINWLNPNGYIYTPIIGQYIKAS